MKKITAGIGRNQFDVISRIRESDSCREGFAERSDRHEGLVDARGQ